ncbi:antibiotic biosynthesis monooxygenase [Vibrio sp. SM6]|uniref:Antibiotic biosynthesis monooxygenase n=1 Tax=Vibrio agarilyticus TaxID=2726741 RepID=A0A7X8YFC5_9VIBR|nr:putative quinol monooxygenase [Vibrio agarilyticus]NLS11499.1 antibiotic biosynthesis monooxygenase [Vibrio agarilyticus]
MEHTLYVMARFRCHTQHIESAKQTLKTLAFNTRTQEDGCISYIYLQDAQDPHIFTPYEIWHSPNAEAAHWKTPHLLKAVEELKDALDGEVTINRYHNIED